MSKPGSPSSFNHDDKTIIRPSPGGYRRHPAPLPPSQDDVAGRPSMDLGGDSFAGANPITASAFPLLSIVPKLRALPFHHAINELQEQLITEIKRFEDRAMRQGSSSEQVRIAGYFLCLLIDETVLNTPWGNQSNWGHHSLLIRFHNEAFGGERFFQILDRLMQQPAQNLNLLELAYLCLSLGFEGKYRLAGSGMREIERLRQELYLVIQRMRGDSERTLSVRWQGLRDMRSPLTRHVPLWVITAVAGSLLMVIYLGFAYAINRASDDAYRQLSAMAREGRPKQPLQLREQAVPSGGPTQGDRFERLLANEISRKMVEVLDGNIVRISNSFPSGSDQIKKEFLPILAKIAQKLHSDSSLILVVGHTDDRPIFSARFPSNWHLSQARAKSVAKALASFEPLQERIRFAGHADSEPIAPNDNEENRARNRRVDIQIR